MCTLLICMSAAFHLIPSHVFYVGCTFLAYTKIINHLFTNVNQDDNSCFSNACDVVNITGNACEGDYLKHRVATTKAMTPIWCKPNVTPDWCECPRSSDFSDFQQKEKNNRKSLKTTPTTVENKRMSRGGGKGDWTRELAGNDPRTDRSLC